MSRCGTISASQRSIKSPDARSRKPFQVIGMPGLRVHEALVTRVCWTLTSTGCGLRHPHPHSSGGKRNCITDCALDYNL